MKYIKFNEAWIDNNKSYTSWWCKLFYFDQKPKANVSYWLLEVDDNGSITKEIAIDENGIIVQSEPRADNRGEWVDSNISINSDDYEQIEYEYFLKYWTEVK